MAQDVTVDETVNPSPDTDSSHTGAAALGLAALAATALAGCQSDGGDGDVAGAGQGRLSAAAVSGTAPTRALTDADAVRFLNQATMGANAASINLLRLSTTTYDSWITNQRNATRSSFLDSLVANKNTYQRYDLIGKVGSDGTPIPHRDQFYDVWWLHAVTGADQLRQRVAFALSEIYVVSCAMEPLANMAYCVASYYDMLSTNAFGSLKTLLKDVCTHPAMGAFLSHLTNRAPEAGSSRIPDQNFAREFLQLFTIGLQELNMDGTPVLNNGQPVETYTQNDVVFLSHFFTGYSWNRAFAVDPAHKTYGFDEPYLPTDEKGPQTVPMLYDDSKHSKSVTTGTKTFLKRGIQVTLEGVLEDPRLASGAKATTKRDLDKLITAVITQHPNVAPFLARRMIQRLVTSNPSPQFVQDVATAFKASDTNNTGDMNLGTLVRAILLHPEARTPTNNTTYGKVREPVLRMTHLLRAFNAGSSARDVNGKPIFRECVYSGDASASWGPASLGQAPLSAPSVFNYFRPDYLLPGKQASDAGAYAPEFQITSEAAVVGYLRHVYGTIMQGFGSAQPPGVAPAYGKLSLTVNGTSYPAVVSAEWCAYAQFNLSDEFNAAYKDQLNGTTTMIDMVNRKLFGGAMSTALKNHIVTECAKVTVANTNYAAMAPLLRERVQLAMMLSMASSEYIVQK